MSGIQHLMFASLALGVLACGKDEPQSTYPDHEINVVVPFGMGGGSDVFARQLVEAADTKLPKPFTVENLPGEDGTKAGLDVITRAADGYTIATGNAGSLIIGPIVRDRPNVKWDAFEPIARIHGEEEFLFLRNASQFQNIDDVVNYARTSSVGLKFGGSVVAGIDSFVYQFLKKAAQMTADYHPFDGGGPAKASFLAGNEDVLIGNYSELSAEIAAHQVFPIAVASETRSSIAPDVPTLKEKGWDVVLIQWRAVVAPKGTPQDRIKVLSDAFRAALDTDGWRSFRSTSNSVDLFLDPTEFKTFLDSEERRYAALINELGL